MVRILAALIETLIPREGEKRARTVYTFGVLFIRKTIDVDDNIV